MEMGTYVMKKIATITAIILAATIVMSACKKSAPKDTKTTPPKQTAQPAKQPDTTTPTTPEQPAVQPSDTATTAPKAEDEPAYTYSYTFTREDGKPKKNPFDPIFIPTIGPIEMFEITQLGVNGVIIHGIKQASVVTPDCTSIVVKIGDKIGVHGGEVVDITLEGVLVREPYVDNLGRIQEIERLIENKPYSCK